MKLFSAGLSSSSAVCLYELLYRVAWSGGLDSWYVVSIFGRMSRICSLYPCNTFHHLGPIVSLYTPCEYSGSPGRFCDDLNKFVYLQIVPLLLRLYQSPMEVFHCNWSHVMLVMQVCCGHYPGLVVAGSQLVLHLANPLLLQLVVVKQGLRFS